MYSSRTLQTDHLRMQALLVPKLPVVSRVAQRSLSNKCGSPAQLRSVPLWLFLLLASMHPAGTLILCCRTKLQSCKSQALTGQCSRPLRPVMLQVSVTKF